jgi:Fe2+ transport system protein FeoA
MQACLSDLKLNESAVVQAVETSNTATRQKLFACGLLPGAKITVRRIAPFGDPIQIQLEGDIILSIRKAEGCGIYVKT